MPKKMGRPPKPEAQRVTEAFTVHLTSSELKAFGAKCKALKVTRSERVRALIKVDSTVNV